MYQTFTKVISRVWGFFFLFPTTFLFLTLPFSFARQVSIFDAAFSKVSGQKNGESIFLETFLSPFKLLKKLYKAELEGIARRSLREFCKDKLWRGTPGREENHFSPGLGE